MIKHLLLTFALVFGLFTLNAQTTILDFESPATTAQFEFFGSSIAPGPMDISIANPDASGINTSANVGEFTKPPGSQDWAGAFADLPRPLVAVIAGGDSGPFTFGPKAAARLATQASAIARQAGGALLVTTSARTSASAADALNAGIDVPNYFYRWRPDATDNPYVGMLAWAERLIVTGDSIAMLSEACATGKPVQMFDLGGMNGPARYPTDFRLGASLYAAMMRWLPQSLSRDITLVHRQLREAGRAVWLEEEPGAVAVPGESDLQRAVAAVQRLLGEN